MTEEETQAVWARFRLAHPELYSLEFRTSRWWPYPYPERKVR